MIGGMLANFAQSKATSMGTDAITSAAAIPAAGGPKGPAVSNAMGQTPAEAAAALAKKGASVFKRDKDGKIIARKKGPPKKTKNNLGQDVELQEYELELVDGNTVTAYQSNGLLDDKGNLVATDGGGHTNCHGQTFAEGEYWINDDQVPKMLTAGGFTSTTSPGPGDIVIYRATADIYPGATGQAVHSVTVVKHDSAGNPVVWGEGGLQTHPGETSIPNAWPLPPSTYAVEYWTK